jgi:undecaprenyl diphosphate synthase
MHSETQDSKLNSAQVPNHIAIIPDGNRRWARDRNLPTFTGHKKGFDIATEVIKEARNLGVHTVTLWAFSTENWNRSQEEIDYLMDMYLNLIDKNLKEAKKDNARIYHLGRKDRIPAELAKKLVEVEEETKDGTSHVLNVALDYGGHDELLRAITKACTDVQSGKIVPEDLFKQEGLYHEKYPYYLFKNYLDTAQQPHPYPDLLIRTSGEQRISGYLSWQCAYAEFYFSQVHFPDFTPEELRKAVDSFVNRKRRFGGN